MVEKDKTRVLAGLQATLENPLTTDKGKERAQQKIESLEGNDGETVDDGRQQLEQVGDPAKGLGRSLPAGEQTRDRTIGGLKATLSNARTSEESKQQAFEQLQNVGSTADIEHASRDLGAPSDERPKGEAAASEHDRRRVGAAKGVLNRADVGEEAKGRARDRLQEAGIDPDTV